MTDPHINVSRMPSFKKGYKKLGQREQVLVKETMMSILEMIQAQVRGDSDRFRELNSQLRVKKINRFKGRKPPLMEASWSGDGRIVWSIETSGMNLLYIHVGGHEVLEKG